jgi:hypothetical protein
MSIKLNNFGKKKLTNVAFVIADPFYKKIWAGVPPYWINDIHFILLRTK